MDISGKLPSILPAAHVNKSGAAKTAALQRSIEAQPSRSPAAGDRVSLSPQVRELQAARAAAAAMPEIREEKVAAIRAQIEAGTYVVDGEKVAGKMIEEALLNAHLK
jgi:negative regulator of flagellin synthesis FlgM